MGKECEPWKQKGSTSLLSTLLHSSSSSLSSMEPSQCLKATESDIDSTSAAAAAGSNHRKVSSEESEDINDSYSSLMSPIGDRLVRFEDTCVVIPESQRPSRVPKLITKSYSVSLWKRGRFGIANQSDAEADVDDGLNEAEASHVKVKLTVPA